MIAELNTELDQSKGIFKKKNREGINERIKQTNSGVDMINIRKKRVEAFMYTVQHNPNNSKTWIDYIVGEMNKTMQSDTNQNMSVLNLTKKEKGEQTEMSNKEFALIFLLIVFIAFLVWIAYANK